MSWFSNAVGLNSTGNPLEDIEIGGYKPWDWSSGYGLFGGETGDIFGAKAAGQASADASINAAQIAAQSQREALDYLKQREEIPQYLREQALQQLGGLYGLNYNAPGAEVASPVMGLMDGGKLYPTSGMATGSPSSYEAQQQMIDEIKMSPLYEALMSGREAGEEAILRHAGATGSMYGGRTQKALYDYNTQLENQALLNLYNQQVQGLGGLAGLSSYAPQIAQYTSGIGDILSQGQIAAAQAQQQSNQNQINSLMGLGKLGLTAFSLFSDRRLKKDIEHIGKLKGHNIYKWRWNKLGNALGLCGRTIGCLADEVHDIIPEAVTVKNGFLFVLYDKLGIFPVSEGV